jgi:hypothetical protein
MLGKYGEALFDADSFLGRSQAQEYEDTASTQKQQ